MDNELKLEDLPNIGSNLAGLLREAGINTRQELFETGSLQAFLRLKSTGNDACFSKLCALEGAVEGLRWHLLSKDKKMELKYFFKSHGKQ